MKASLNSNLKKNAALQATSSPVPQMSEMGAGGSAGKKSTAVSVCIGLQRILIYVMAGGYLHDFALPVCPINLQSSRL